MKGRGHGLVTDCWFHPVVAQGTMAIPTVGRISRGLAALSGDDRERLRRPHPDLLEVLDPRATSLLAADLLETIGPTSTLTLFSRRHHAFQPPSESR